MMKHSRCLKIYRVENNLTQKQLAVILGISQAYLSAIEKGKIPTDKVKRKISDVLNINIVDIFFT